jgi:glutamate/tyrosine decarboxylase-like PLP-dependent enzyme
MDELDELHPLFVGAYAENAQILEEMIVEFLRDHLYWRRNFHPEDVPPIPTSAQYREDYVAFLGALKREMFRLSADLKRSVPFFSPRYVGHMASDLLLPGVIAKIITTLYNPNNVSQEASPATLEKELEVGMQLARMVGYPCDTVSVPCAWGHLTSGGTVANYEGLRNISALKFYPLALAEAVRATRPLQKKIATPVHAMAQETTSWIEDASAWQLANLSIDQIVSLRQGALSLARKELGQDAFEAFCDAIEYERLEALGMVEFFEKHPALRNASVLVPGTAHYSWEKSLKILGWGKRNLITVRTDAHMRMDIAHLRQILAEHAQNKRPILAIIGVLGTTEFGTVDPLKDLLDTRDAFRDRGLEAAVHIDAAWGGYLATMFRRPDGGVYPRELLRKQFHYFPSQTVYDAFTAIGRSDSITIDPHKLGYIPYAAGAYVARNRGMIDFIAQRAAYVFDVAEEREQDAAADAQQKLKHLGQYILEGSKPGSSVAAAYVTHRVIPLDGEGFGKILRHTVRCCEYFFDTLEEWREEMAEYVTVTTPIPPDSNLICLAINPVGNTSLAAMNRFGRALFSNLNVDPSKPIQQRDFIASYTSLLHGSFDTTRAAEILTELGVEPSSFAPSVREEQDDHIFILRHTLMNPWLMAEQQGTNYIDRYLAILKALIIELTERGRW